MTTDEGQKKAFVLNPEFKDTVLAFFKIFMNCRIDGEVIFQNALAAAAYYVALLEMPSKGFENVYDSVKLFFTSREINKNSFELGREELLSYGFLAQIILLDPLDNTRSRLKSCLTHSTRGDLPVNPSLIWEMKNPSIKAGKDIENLENLFKTNFSSYGLGAEKSELRSITCLYSSRWFYYTLINHILCDASREKQLHMMFGKLGSFREPYVTYYEKMFKEGLTIQALLDGRRDDIRKKAEALQKKYPKLDIRFTPIALKTIRHLVSDRMAIDARKISERKEPSYIGTIYLADNLVKDFEGNFNSLWTNAKES